MVMTKMCMCHTESKCLPVCINIYHIYRLCCITQELISKSDHHHFAGSSNCNVNEYRKLRHEKCWKQITLNFIIRHQISGRRRNYFQVNDIISYCYNTRKWMPMYPASKVYLQRASYQMVDLFSDTTYTRHFINNQVSSVSDAAA